MRIVSIPVDDGALRNQLVYLQLVGVVGAQMG